ncbi:MAG: sigma-70 family RNA polymerase sigma factor [Tidjanibacter sp.]|nr:sigma-70 family RNA polymerase sigma factor [Tidjanibacter sp.]
MTLQSIIEGLQRGDSEARRELYQHYSTAMFSLVRRYVQERAAAEDVFHDAFVTLFTKVGDYRGEGSFEGWMRRIFVTTALNHLRRDSSHDYVDNDIGDLPPGKAGSAPPEALEQLSNQELLQAMEQLPEGYRTVVNLHAVEGYSHAEIAKMLAIEESTSRSQYLRAKARLAKILERYKLH